MTNHQEATWPRLCCLECGCPLATEQALLCCSTCGERYPVLDGTPRLLRRPLRDGLLPPLASLRSCPRRPASGPDSEDGYVGAKLRTAASFGFEWQRFPRLRTEWERNFLTYMQPRNRAFFQGKRVLDVGCGIGRHAYYAARYGAEVAAVDLSEAINVARENTRELGSVTTVQADLYQLPFEPESFDFIYSLGVLHHLPDPEGAFRSLLRYLKPGGEILIYLYWRPEGQPLKRALLSAISALREVTTRLPHPALYCLSYPLAAAAWAGFVAPYRLLCSLPATASLAERLPMKQYAAYPFQVCVNDQFDRFSAPIENRYTQAQVQEWLESAGLEAVSVLPNCGWLGSGRKRAVDAVAAPTWPRPEGTRHPVPGVPGQPPPVHPAAAPEPAAETQPTPPSPRAFDQQLRIAVLVLSLLMAGIESVQQVHDAGLVGTVARAVVQQANARTVRARVIALRDYIRHNVTYLRAPYDHRPFLRATAGETLRSREGYCGEVTRTFICMAAAVGIRAQRINLYGARPHVVAEAELAPGDPVIVDCQNPPQVADLETLDRVVLRPDYNDYGTLNLRRLHISWLVTRLKLRMGPLTYWTENPHALMALAWFLVPATLTALRGARSLLRCLLHRRGWVHITDVRALQAAVMAPSSEPRPVS